MIYFWVCISELNSVFIEYIQKFAYESLTSDEWKEFLYSHFSDEKHILDTVDWETWFYAAGMPPVKGEYDTSLQDVCTDLAQKWISGKIDNVENGDVQELSSSQIQEFLDQLLASEPLDHQKLEKMAEKYTKISQSKVRVKPKFTKEI